MSRNQQFRSAADIERAVSQLVENRVRALVSAELHRVAEQYANEPPLRRARKAVRKAATRRAPAKRGAMVQAVRKSLTAIPTTPRDIRTKAHKLEPGINAKNTSVILSNLFHKSECQRSGPKYKYKYFKKS